MSKLISSRALNSLTGVKNPPWVTYVLFRPRTRTTGSASGDGGSGFSRNCGTARIKDWV
jgi:hypothetical protein